MTDITTPQADDDLAPLAGIKVVEITSIYSGPLAGVLLAELGANVIKVESQGKPDLTRNNAGDPYAVSPVFYSLNRGKRFASIDATVPAGRQVLVDLVANADVFLHNIRPGKPEALGLDYAELAARNPKLIYAAISGLGTDGPSASEPVYDYVIQARIGMVDYQRDTRTNKASLVSQVLVDKTTSQATVQAILAALLVRHRTGRGQRIDIPMLGVGLHFEWPDAMAPVYAALTPALPLDQLPPHLLRVPSSGLIVITANDGGEIACSPLLPPFDGFAIALDRTEWIVDDRYAETPTRMAHLPDFLVEVHEAAQAFDAEELLARLRANGVAAGPIVRRANVHHDPQIKHLGLLVERENEHLGQLRQPVPMWHFGTSTAHITTSIGRTGAHTVEVLREAGLADVEITRLLDAGAIAQHAPTA